MSKHPFFYLGIVLSMAIHLETRGQADTLNTPIQAAPICIEHAIRFNKTEWFGKQKFTIEDYASGYDKRGTTTVDQTRKKGINEFRTKYKFKVFLENNLSNAVQVDGEAIILENQTAPGVSVMAVVTGGDIETESIDQLGFMKFVTGSIKTDLEPDDKWFITLKKINYFDLDTSSVSFLTNQQRKILIMQSDADNESGNGIYRSYLFTEEGKSLGSIRYRDEIILSFNPELEPQLKMVLTAAMITLNE